MTYGEIRNIAGNIINEKIDDYRPACTMFVDELKPNTAIPNAIICWLKNGDKIIYIAKERDENEQ